TYRTTFVPFYHLIPEKFLKDNPILFDYVLLQQPAKQFLSFLIEIDTKVQQDLIALKQYQFKSYYSLLGYLWNFYKSEFVVPLYSSFEELLQKNRNITMQELKMLIASKSKDEQEQFSKLLQ